MSHRGWAANGLVILGVVATVAGYAISDDVTVDNGCYLGVLVAAAVGAWVGAEHSPRGRRLVPRLIATGVSLSALGDVLWTVLDLRGVSTDVSIADPPWFVSYVLLGAALWVILGRSARQTRNGRRIDADFVIDVATIVAVCGLVLWITSIDAIVDDQSVSPLVRAVWVAYPIADTILLALVLRVLMSSSARNTIDASFAVGVCLWLFADLGYLIAPDADGKALLALDTAWMVAPVLLARSAWRVGGRNVDPSRSTLQGGYVGQLVLAVGPLVVPPAVELAADLRGAPDEPLRLLTGTLLMLTLGVVRIARLLRSKERASREAEAARDLALEASRVAQKALHTKPLFVANVSHELRTPLTSVLASGEMLEDTPLDDFQGRLVEKVNRSGEMLRTLVEGILDFSRIEAGQLELNPTAFDLRGLVTQVVDTFSTRAVDQGLELRASLDPALPSRVVGDCGRILQVVSNLVDNAVKFTHEGHVSLTVRPVAEAVGQQGIHVEFAVSDSGIGISDTDKDLVFESFSQVDGSTTRSYGGSGLGLAICKQLTELMGGSITLTSQLEVGTRIVVRVPLTRDEHEPSSSSTPGLVSTAADRPSVVI